jgi:hypothetical protein
LAQKKQTQRQRSVQDQAQDIARRSIAALVIRTLGSALNLAIKWGVLGFLGYTMTPYLAGKVTQVGVSVQQGDGKPAAAWSLDSLHYFLATVGIFLGMGWYVERLNRKKTTELMSERTRSLELRLDDKRSSSGLGADGKSPEEE